MSYVEDAQTNPDAPHTGIKLCHIMLIPEEVMKLPYDEYVHWITRTIQEQSHMIHGAAMDKYYERNPLYNPAKRTEFTGM